MPAVAVPTDGADSARPGAGIAAVGGNPGTIGGNRSCGQQPDAAGEPITIAYVGADLDELEAIGLETVVVEDPSLMIGAYVNALNLNGGVSGRCIHFKRYLWSLDDPVESFQQLCAQLPQQQPLVLLSLALDQTTFQCATLAAEIPTLGIFTTMPDTQFVAARGRLFVDQGSEEYLMSSGVNIALQVGELTLEDRVGLFGVASGTTVLVIEQAGLTVAGTALVPPEYADLGILGMERQARLLEAGLSGSEQQAARLFRQQLPPDRALLLERIEQRFLGIAGEFRDAGVTTVVAGAGWADVRRLMRAAELVGWYPRWITNDFQPAVVMLSRAPARQAANVVQISARRAAGDDIPELDRSCLSLRNTHATDFLHDDDASDRQPSDHTLTEPSTHQQHTDPVAGSHAHLGRSLTEPFRHRFHTDAWNLLASVCDYLDVIFGAISRVDGTLGTATFVEAMAGTNYETAFGSLIKYDRTDYFGSDRFRVLRADPACVVNSWGCMRAVSDWLIPS